MYRAPGREFLVGGFFMNERFADSCLRYGVTGLAVVGLLTSAACSSSGGGKSGGNSSSSGGTTSSSSGAPSTSPSSPSPSGGTAPSETDLTATLINPADIPGDTFTLKSAQPVNQAPATGIAGVFSNAAGTRTVSDILVWLPTDSDADTALTGELTAAKQQITSGLTDAPLSVGTGGHIFSGSDANGAATIILYQEGNYVVTIEFNSKGGDAIPAALATQVATAQDTKVKAAL